MTDQATGMSEATSSNDDTQMIFADDNNREEVEKAIKEILPSETAGDRDEIISQLVTSFYDTKKMFGENWSTFPLEERAMLLIYPFLEIGKCNFDKCKEMAKAAAVQADSSDVTDPFDVKNFRAAIDQSSGMGKTKILHEYRKWTEKEADVTCKLVLSGPAPHQTSNELFDDVLDLEGLCSNVTAAKVAATKIFEELDRRFLPPQDMEIDDSQIAPTDGIGQRSSLGKTVVLLFDEAQQYLLNETFGYQVFLFCVVRLWLRERRNKPNVVAVFTGTNAKLRNFQFENDEALWADSLATPREFQPKARTFNVKRDRKRSPSFSTQRRPGVFCLHRMRGPEVAQTLMQPFSTGARCSLQ